MGAYGINIKGGFEGLGDIELDTQHVSPITMQRFNNSKLKEKDEDLLSLALSDAQNESLSTNSTPPRLNPDVNGGPIPNPSGCKNAGPSTGVALTWVAFSGITLPHVHLLHWEPHPPLSQRLRIALPHVHLLHLEPPLRQRLRLRLKKKQQKNKSKIQQRGCTKRRIKKNGG